MTSIRERLISRLLIAIGLPMTVVAVALFVGVRAALVRQFDRTLEARLALLESSTRWDGKEVDLDYVPQAMPWYGAVSNPEYFVIQTLSNDGAVVATVATSPSLNGQSLNLPEAGGDVVAGVRLPDGRRGRLATRVVLPAPDEPLDQPGKEQLRAVAMASAPRVRVAAAMSCEPLNRTVTTIGVSLIAASAVVALALVLGVRYALATGLAPLREFSREIGALQPDVLSNRIPGTSIPEELQPVHARLNDFIERLEVAFEHERRFASAAAHELRTPVAELRSLLEVALSRPRTAEDAHESMAEALEISIRISHLIRALLILARAPQDRTVASWEPIDVSQLLISICARYEQRVLARGGRVDIDPAGPAVIHTDHGALEVILSNVVDNAVCYSDPQPVIRCTMKELGPSTLQIEVANPAGSITADQVEQFFKPFWRKSTSRSDQAHLGLGLSVSRSLARAIGGDITARLDQGCVRIEVTLGRHDSEGDGVLP